MPLITIPRNLAAAEVVMMLRNSFLLVRTSELKRLVIMVNNRACIMLRHTLLLRIT